MSGLVIVETSISNIKPWSLMVYSKTPIDCLLPTSLVTSLIEQDPTDSYINKDLRSFYSFKFFSISIKVAVNEYKLKHALLVISVV